MKRIVTFLQRVPRYLLFSVPLFLLTIWSSALWAAKRPFITIWQFEKGQKVLVPIYGNGITGTVRAINYPDATFHIVINEDDPYIFTAPYSDKYEMSIDPEGVEFIRVSKQSPGLRSSLLRIVQWGDVEWTTMKEAFYRCENMELSPKAGKPDLRKVEDALSMFSGCSKFNTPIGFWDVSNLRYMFSMFDDTPFNQDLSAWKLDNVEWLSFNGTGIPPEKLAKFISIWASNPKLRKKGELVVCGEEYMNSDAIRKAFRKWRQMRPRWDISFGEGGDFDE